MLQSKDAIADVFTVSAELDQVGRWPGAAGCCICTP